MDPSTTCDTLPALLVGGAAIIWTMFNTMILSSRSKYLRKIYVLMSLGMMMATLMRKIAAALEDETIDKNEMREIKETLDKIVKEYRDL